MQELLFVKFQDQLEEAMKELVPEGAKIHFHETGKNNGVIYQAVTILEKGNPVSPDIHLEEFFADYKRGTQINKIAKDLIHFWEEHKQDTGFRVEDFSDYENAKPRLRFRVVNYEENRERLSHMPHIPFLDLAVVFFYHVDTAKKDLQGSIQIEDSHLALWGIDKEELTEVAVNNTLQTMEVRFVGICKVLNELMGNHCEMPFEPEEEPNMYVLSNKDNYFGAAVLYAPKILSRVSEKMKGDFLVIPSSVHEVIVIPSGAWADYERLNAIITEINEEQVAREEVLSNHLYYYDSDRSELKIPC